MFRSLLSACSIVVLVLPSIFFPTKTQACPIKLPETLLSLYRNSDAIYVARFSKVDDEKIIERSETRTVATVMKHFDISSALKGEPRKLFSLEERDYRYNDGQPEIRSGDVEEQDDADTDALYRRPNLKPGDTVLLFVKETANEDGTKTLGLADYRDAIKKMSTERLAAYEARINELNSLFSGKKAPAAAAILEWLIHCTQDPLTRWEGAFELQQSYEAMVWQDRQEKEEAEEEAKQSDQSEEPTDSTEATEAASDPNENVTTEQVAEEEIQSDSEEIDNATYARLLTDAHKQTLMNVLLDSTHAASGRSNNAVLSTGDQALLELVSNWGDLRLARVLVDRMQIVGDDPYLIFQLMRTTSEILGDKELDKIADEYSDVYYEDGSAFVDADDEEESTPESDEADKTETEIVALPGEVSDATAAETTASSNEKVEEKSAAESEGKRHVTFGEVRAELLTKFMARSTVAIANAERKEKAEK